MNFEWMEGIPALKKAKDAISIRHRIGDIYSMAPKLGIVPKPHGRKFGISAMMRLKNESTWIGTAIRSLAPFVEQFSIVDNGSTDGTPDIVRRVAEELSLDYVLEILPTPDFGEVCDRALQNTTCHWVLRWDGDMIARTTGDLSFARIREFALSLDRDRYYAVYFPHIRLEGDLFHQDPAYKIQYEEWLFTYSSSLFHRRTGRYRELILPLYYRRLYNWATGSFHIASLDNPFSMIQRKYWEAWRKLDDRETYPTLESYAKTRIGEEYGLDSLEDAGVLHMRERFRNLAPYNHAKYGDYPELMKPFLESYPDKIIYRNNHIVGRSDIISILDRLDDARRKTRADVIILTRNREEFVVDAVKKLLEDTYPHYQVIVCDQSDEPSELLRDMAETTEKLIYHTAQTRGLPPGRNEALTHSTAEIVIFVDDDVVPEPGFVEGHVMAYEKLATVGVVGKIFELRPDMMKPVKEEKIGRVNFWIGEIYRGFTIDHPKEVGSVQGANMSFRRKELVESGGFDSRFGGSFLFEETDVCLTLGEKGLKILYTPDATLTHLGAVVGGCRLPDKRKELYWYCHNFTLLYLKHSPRRTFPVFFGIRIAKICRDALRSMSIPIFFTGLKGLRDGFVSYRSGNRATEK